MIALVNALTDAQVLGLTLFGEARNQPVEGRIAVANVIRNRTAAQRPAWGLTARAVCLAPAQFSCWNNGTDANHTLLLDTAAVMQRGQIGPLLKESLWIAQGALDGQFADNTHGSTSYLTADLYDTNPPSWAQGVRILARIGAHVFLRAA